MTFDPDSGALEGVPSEEHVGLQYVMEVASTDPASDLEKDMFTIDVVPHKTHLDTDAMPLKDTQTDTMKPIRCPAGSSVTMATIIVDVELPAMLSRDKAKLMRGLSAHLGMPVELLRLSPKGSLPMFDSSALVAGPGNVKSPQTTGAQLQWEVGCGNVYAPQMSILQQLETTSSDGLSDAIGADIVGWYVTNNKPHTASRMKRRVHVRATPATPAVDVGPPTGRVMPTVVIARSTTTDGGPTRVVPAIKPSHTHKGRVKTIGRHVNKSLKHSPSRKLDKTDLARQEPSQVIAATPTVKGGEATMQHIEPTFVEPSRGVSRTHDLLEPSTTSSWRSSTSEPTQVLPTHTAGVVTDRIRPTKPMEFTPPTIIIPITEKPIDYAPKLNKGIGRVKVRVGNILDYTIPRDIFSDAEDGDTRNLNLALLTVDLLTLPRTSWLKFNSTSQRMYGQPLPEHISRQAYVLMAMDTHGNIARTSFSVVVQRQSHQHKNHEFSLLLDLNYYKFVTDVDQRIDVATKLAGVYGDNDLSKITVTKISPGSVEYAWRNNSVPRTPCPVKEIDYLLRFLITTNNTLNATLIEKMKPYRIMRAGAKPYGACAEDGGSPLISTVLEPSQDVDGETIASQPRDTSDDDLLITMIVPVAIIVALLLIAAIIACVLYRRKRRGKLSDEDQDTFIKKGIPIIFTDELDEKPDPPTKPIIMDDEKPPMQPPPQYSPPGYQRGSEASSPHSQHKEPFLPSSDEDDPMSTYQRPAPFTANSTLEGRNSRPRAQPAYRSPPPYVPP